MTVRLVGVGVLLALTSCGGSSSPPAPSPAPSLSPEALPSPSAVEASPSPMPTRSPAVAASPAQTVAALPRCTSAHLRLSLRQGDGGAGQFHQPLVLTNRGPRCTLHGYPGVSFVDRAGSTLGSPAEQTAGPVRRVLLAPGRSAMAVLTYSNAAAFPDSSCRPKQAVHVRVYPPGDRVALFAADPILVCSAKGANQLHIEPLMPG